MTERFIYYPISQIIEDKETGKRYYGNKSIVLLLEDLNHENCLLKERLNRKENHIKRVDKDWDRTYDFIEYNGLLKDYLYEMGWE